MVMFGADSILNMEVDWVGRIVIKDGSPLHRRDGDQSKVGKGAAGMSDVIKTQEPKETKESKPSQWVGRKRR